MECVELSDLEEGEILENENDSHCNLSETWSDEFGSVKNQYELVGEYKIKKFRNKENKVNSLLSSENNGYKNLTKNCRLSDKSGSKSNVNIVDLGLEEVSSDGDCLSEDDWKHSCGDLDYKMCKKKRPQYGTAEDIMSEIGETISRKKSHCPHKKRKAKYNFDKYKDDYYLWCHKSSHVKSKKFRKRLDLDNFNSNEILTQGRKRKKRTSYITEETIKKPKIRDFDEVRQTLLEKLKKQKAEEAKGKVENLIFAQEEVENSEIQEVEMGIDNTNNVDNPNAGNSNQKNVINESEKDKEEENDDLDLIELRLAALESNSKQRGTSTNQKRTKNESNNEKSEDVNLDKYELLLRAEALKTALLKKHQKRLNKAKEISSGANSSSNNNFLNTFLPLRGESSSDKKPDTSNISNVDVTKDNTQGKVESQIHENTGKSSNEMRITTPLMSSLNLKKAKTKRRKRKSESLQNAKENTENTEALEEDDRTLRTQLLRDLLSKKSLKDSDKKTVLTDSVQTSANQLHVLSSEQLEEKGKSLVTATKNNSLEKVNVVNTTKPAAVPRIPKPEIKRIIVHLGSEDSSDENDTEGNSSLTSKENKEKNVSTKETNDSIRANYEKSVDLLLSQTWQKIEWEIAAAKNAHNTPEAVYKHLPLSQRLEYIRLKQKIAERERLKKMKKNSEKPSSGSSNQDSTPCRETFLLDSAPLNEAGTTLSNSENCKPDINLQETGVVNKNVPLNSKSVRNLNQVNDKQKSVVIRNVNAVKNGRKYVAPPNGMSAIQTNQRRSLLQSSQALISKLKILLKKIKIDKTIEENYEKEITKLKNQINLFEKKKVEQKMKIKKLAEESLKTYKLIQQITSLAKKPKDETVEKKDCDDGVSNNEKVAKVSEGATNEEIIKVPEESKNDISKVKGKAEEEQNESENVPLSNAGPLDYNSPLIAFNKVSDNSNRVDPNVMICQFDLMGVCKDKECTYQHFRSLQTLQYLSGDSVCGKPIQEEKDLSK